MSCSFFISVSLSSLNLPLPSFISPLVCCTCRTDIPVSDLALLSSHSHTLNHSHSSSFIPQFLFTAEPIQCLRVSHHAWDDFYRHFKSPYSLLLSSSLHFHSFHILVFHIIFI